MAKRGRPFKRSQAEIEAIKELRRMYSNLKRRIDTIQEKYGVSYYDKNKNKMTEMPAVEQFYQKGLDKFSVKNKSLEELNTLRAEVEFVSSFKTSYVKGVENYQNYVAEWIDLYDKDIDAYNNIFDLYNKLVEENEITEKFKYAIIEEIYTVVETKNMTPEERYLHMREFFNDLYLNTRIEDLLGGSGYAVGGKVR